MKVLVVAKTRRGGGACVGGISGDGRSVRLIAADGATLERAGLEYEVGDVWEVDAVADPDVVPPHVENLLVRRAGRLRRSERLVETIHRFMPPVRGDPHTLFEGLLQVTPAGALYIAHRTGLPHRSTMFWLPDRSLELDTAGKRLRYRYPTDDGGRTLTFVGFQEPIRVIRAGTLLRVSLAHWWRPHELPDEEPRCFVQLSGWFVDGTQTSSGLVAIGGARLRTSHSAGEGSPARPQPRPTDGSRADQPAQPKRDTHETAENPILDPLPGSSGSASAEGLQPARRLLKLTFGFSDFLPVQAEVVARVLQRRDTLAVMPTGGGKSLCYQLPALLFDGLTVVVSPLVALMQDQVRQLHELGVAAAALNHMVPLPEYTAITARARRGDLRILYLSPETLLRPETLLLLEESRLACLAVDEAHCISEWGHDFRPEYRQLQAVRRRFPRAVCLALTATATTRVRADIRRLLELPAEFVASFNRPNLFLAVEHRLDGLAQILAFLEPRRGQPGIIYCGTRRQCDELSAALNANGWLALAYHAGLADDVRRQNQHRFIHDEVPLMVATVAFGMGINKSNVRFVLHAHLPKDLESYYQEIGRAGRDGLPADCLLLYTRGDAMVHRHFIQTGAAAERPGRQARLNALLGFAEARGCRRVPLLAYFGETIEPPCGHCDVCARGPVVVETADATDVARNFLEFGSLRFTSKGRAVLEGRERVLVPVECAPRQVRGSVTAHGHDPTLFERLRQLRRQLADAAGVPAYLVFSDRTLVEMAERLPQNAAGLRQVNGVGESKLAKYGSAFLELIRAHCQEHGVTPRTDAAPAPAPPAPIVRPLLRRRFHEVGELFALGHSVDEIAGRFGVARETVIQHLHRFCEAGGVLDPDRLLAESRLSEPDRVRVFAAFARLGLERLAPVHDALSGSVDYEELHLLRLCLRCREVPMAGA